MSAAQNQLTQELEKQSSNSFKNAVRLTPH